MTDENGRPITSSEWRMFYDAYIREREADRLHRGEVANILREYREEAKAANDERLEHLNGFQRQFDKALGTFITTERYEQQSETGSAAIASIGREVDRRLGAIETKQENFATKKDVSDLVSPIQSTLANWAGRMAAYGIVGALVASGVTSLIVYVITK